SPTTASDTSCSIASLSAGPRSGEIEQATLVAHKAARSRGAAACRTRGRIHRPSTSGRRSVSRTAHNDPLHYCGELLQRRAPQVHARKDAVAIRDGDRYRRNVALNSSGSLPAGVSEWNSKLMSIAWSTAST